MPKLLIIFKFIVIKSIDSYFIIIIKVIIILKAFINELEIHYSFISSSKESKTKLTKN